MRTLIFFAFLICSQTAFALGPEEQEFVGTLGNRTVTLGFLGDPNLYGAKMSGLSKCSYEGERILCSSGHQEKSGIIYLRNEKQPSSQLRQARQLYKKLYPHKKIGRWNSEGVYQDDFFVCQKGCSKAVPSVFILITHGD